MIATSMNGKCGAEAYIALTRSHSRAYIEPVALLDLRSYPEKGKIRLIVSPKADRQNDIS